MVLLLPLLQNSLLHASAAAAAAAAGVLHAALLMTAWSPSAMLGAPAGQQQRLMRCLHSLVEVTAAAVVPSAAVLAVEAALPAALAVAALLAVRCEVHLPQRAVLPGHG
jgi:hypothetical protein